MHWAGLSVFVVMEAFFLSAIYPIEYSHNDQTCIDFKGSGLSSLISLHHHTDCPEGFTQQPRVEKPALSDYPECWILSGSHCKFLTDLPS